MTIQSHTHTQLALSRPRLQEDLARDEHSRNKAKVELEAILKGPEDQAHPTRQKIKHIQQVLDRSHTLLLALCSAAQRRAKQASQCSSKRASAALQN